MTMNRADCDAPIWIYLLSLSSFLAGIVGALGHLLPRLMVPPALMVALDGVLALLLGGLLLISLLTDERRWRLTSGVLLLVLSAYSLLHNTLASDQDAGLSVLTSYERLSTVPALCVGLLGLVGLLGFGSRIGKLTAVFAGSLGVGVAIFVLGMLLAHEQPSDKPLQIAGFKPVSALFCGFYGVLLLILAGKGEVVKGCLDRKSALFGMIGVAATFLMLMASSGVSHLERHNVARYLANHHAAMLRHDMGAAYRLIDRLANRWASLDYQIPVPLLETEASRYFSDTASLHGLLVFAPSGKVVLDEGRDAESNAWLRQQLTRPGVQRHTEAVQSSNASHSWVIPDPEKPLHALLLLAPTGGHGSLFVARFDLEQFLPSFSGSSGRGFLVHFATDHSVSRQPMRSGHEHREELYEQVLVDVASSPPLYVHIVGGPVSMLSPEGLLVPSIIIFGLFVTYLLIKGQVLLNARVDAMRDLRAKDDRIQSLFYQSPDAVFEFSSDGRYLAVNDMATGITGLVEGELGQMTYHDLFCADNISEDDYRRFDQAFDKTITGTAQEFEVEFRNITGQQRHYECTFIPILANNEIEGLYAVVKDVTEKNIGQESQRLLKESLESSDDAVLVVDTRKSHLPVVFVNSAFSRIIGYRHDDIRPISFNELRGFLEDEVELQAIHAALAEGHATSLTIRSHRIDGSTFWNQISLSPVRDDSGAVTHFTAIMKDISDKREQELTLAYQATHDALTGLANRALLEDRLEHDMAIAQRNKSHLAVLFIDLDEFKPINDTLGHRIGDEVLVSVARKLEAVIRPTDTLARFGGDEFVLLLPNIQSRQEAQEVADRVLEVVGQPHHVGAHELYVTASIGISLLNEDLDFANKLIQQADMAMYQAKQQGRDTYEVFSHDLDTVLSRRVTLRNELQEAIRDGQLYLNYQPQVNQDGRVCGLEALVRWKHPQKGIIPPNEFIPVAEETGQIIHLGRWVANQACRDAAVLLSMGLLRGRMAVNLSPLQFHRPGFLSSLKVLMEQTGLAGHHLELEITEGILMRNTEAAIDILADLRDLGIATSIDDFGTGFSSFSYLKDLPVDAVKIDRSFVDNVTTSQRDAAVCQGVLTMARAMGVQVIAEGVETREQFEQLKVYGCESFQGYFFAKPMAFDDLVHWMRLNLAVH